MMNTRQWISAALAAVLLVGGSSTAWAQHQDWGRGDSGPGAFRGGADRHDGSGVDPRRFGPGPSWGPGRPQPQRYAPMPPRRMPPPMPAMRPGYPMAGPGMRPGGRLPNAYRQPYYVVDRWYDYPRLAPPPRGYHWVQAGTDFALVAIASGIIASVILGN